MDAGRQVDAEVHSRDVGEFGRVQKEALGTVLNEVALGIAGAVAA